MRIAAAAALTFALMVTTALAEEPSSSQETALLRAYVGRSVVIDSPVSLKRVSLTDPAIASATVISPRQVLLHGHQPGAVTLILWDEGDHTRPFELIVEHDLDPLRETLGRALPNEAIKVDQSRGSIVLSGQVSSQAVAEQAVALAQTHSEGVVNLLEEIPVQVLLKVRVAEVDRKAFKELGFSFFTTGLANSNAIGQIGTGQFSSALGSIGAVPADVSRGRDPDAPNLVAGGIGRVAEGTPAVFGLSDLLNVFFFLPDRNVGGLIQALEGRNMLELLAEPNLLAQNGREASFLAGGEFPFPTVQAVTGGIPAVTIVFREFGIRLNFTPTVSAGDQIKLKIVQEVSALDFSNALTISGFVVPALTARRTETELQLKDGQSFAISGLIDKRLTEVSSKIPGLGDIPFLGKLFRSSQKQRQDQELLVLVTPKVVRPLEPGERHPDYPDLELERVPSLTELEQEEKDVTEAEEAPPAQEAPDE